jgi:hypothetical protein
MASAGKLPPWLEVETLLAINGCLEPHRNERNMLSAWLDELEKSPKLKKFLFTSATTGASGVAVATAAGIIGGGSLHVRFYFFGFKFCPAILMNNIYK